MEDRTNPRSKNRYIFLKFRYSEKATKIYLTLLSKLRDFFQIFVSFKRDSKKYISMLDSLLGILGCTRQPLWVFETAETDKRLPRAAGALAVREKAVCWTEPFQEHGRQTLWVFETADRKGCQRVARDGSGVVAARRHVRRHRRGATAANKGCLLSWAFQDQRLSKSRLSLSLWKQTKTAVWKRLKFTQNLNGLG